MASSKHNTTIDAMGAGLTARLGSQNESIVLDSPSLPPQPTSSPPPTSKSLHGISDSNISTSPGRLPPQLLTLLSTIQKTLRTQFPDAPPHTSQRLAELLLRPKSHYRTLPSYLRALDRVVSVSSPTTTFPLPSAPSPNASTLLNGSMTPVNGGDSADDNLGGAALTPISWLSNKATSDTVQAVERLPGSDLRTQSTSLIDGPNGEGSVETVTVAPNGNNPVLAAGQNAVTQGELIRQEQEAGIVPVPIGQPSTSAVMAASKQDAEDEEEMTPHARGPEEIGMEDMGPQRVATGGFDVEAALGRKGEGEGPVAKPSVPEERANIRDQSEAQPKEGALEDKILEQGERKEDPMEQKVGTG
ncbi:MAG: hypothetical protein LQ342_000502 [Letrouitia transgressa]|nr:MAG: hypothetical protein LQ342_000502 [Letrouitia transgressa]